MFFGAFPGAFIGLSIGWGDHVVDMDPLLCLLFVLWFLFLQFLFTGRKTLFLLCFFLASSLMVLYTIFLIYITTNITFFCVKNVRGSCVVDMTPLLYFLFILGRTILLRFPMDFSFMNSQTPCRCEFTLAEGTPLLWGMRHRNRHVSSRSLYRRWSNTSYWCWGEMDSILPEFIIYHSYKYILFHSNYYLRPAD